MIVGLVTGSGKLADMGEAATDPGHGFDAALRKRLTTKAVSADVEPIRRGVVTIGEVRATSPLASADRVVAWFRARFRACYQMGLREDPSMAGTLVLSARLRADGSVESATIVSKPSAPKSGISTAVADCTTNVLRRAQFGNPVAAGVTVTVPLTFTP